MSWENDPSLYVLYLEEELSQTHSNDFAQEYAILWTFILALNISLSKVLLYSAQELLETQKTYWGAKKVD